MIASIFPQNIK